MVRRFELAVTVCLGVALLLNPVYLYPDGGGPERTYEAIELTDDGGADTELASADGVLVCPGPRSCALETRIASEGSIEYRGPVDREQGYDVVGIEGEWYLPRTERDGDVTLLTLDHVSPMEAVAAVAEPIDEHDEVVRTAVARGTVTVHGEREPAFERRAVVEADGDYFLLLPGSSSTHWTDGYGLLLARVLSSTLGAGVIALGALIWANRTRRGGT